VAKSTKPRQIAAAHSDLFFISINLTTSCNKMPVLWDFPW